MPRAHGVGGGQVTQEQRVAGFGAFEEEHGGDLVASAEDVDPDGVGAAGESGGDAADLVGAAVDA